MARSTTLVLQMLCVNAAPGRLQVALLHTPVLPYSHTPIRPPSLQSVVGCDLVWGYSSERCSEMDCNYCSDETNESCDWGNYFTVLDANPTDFGYQLLWSSGDPTQTWITTPTDLDALRMSPSGCTIDVATGTDGGGDVYSFSSDVRVCGNPVGCDSVRSVRVVTSGRSWTPIFLALSLPPSRGEDV